MLTDASLSKNRRNAVIVRLGEKRILFGTLKRAQTMIEKLRVVASNGSQKRKGTEHEHTKGKKSRR